MTPTLRRAHHVIWLGLALGLPIGFVAALRLNNVSPVQEPPPALSPAAPLPMLVKSVQTPGILANLRGGEQPSARQLELIVQQPLEVPSVVVRMGNATGQAIGQLDVAGVYRFKLPDSSAQAGFTLTDEVHHTVLQTINF